MTTRDERRFTVFARGAIRDGIILKYMRNSMRVLINPVTDIEFTEDEITRATQPGSRFYIEADAIDLWAQAGQQRALFFTDQIDPRSANTQFLQQFHARLWLGEEDPLPATGGSGFVSANATVGAIFPGSTTVPDPAAAVARDDNGVRYQVLQNVVTPANGVAVLTIRAIDGGVNTNPQLNDELTWVGNQPLTAETTALVSSNPGFTGGFDEETDAEQAIRVEERIRERPAAGNAPHFNAWSKQANVGVEQAFVYAAALFAGSVVVAVVQKRGSGVGPEARIASPGLLIDVQAYITPPASAVVPARAFVLATPTIPQSSNLEIEISMTNASSGGWQDAEPYPEADQTFENQITAVTDQLNFEFSSLTDLPGGASSLTGTDVPSMMVWFAELSRFEELQFGSTGSITRVGNVNTIVLETATSDGTIQVDQRISPFTAFKTIIAESIEEFFDELGPGQVVDLDTDPRGARAIRNPAVSQSFPIEAGDTIAARIVEALGGAAPNANLVSISRTEPDLPNNITDGPNQVTLGQVSITPL